MFLLSHFRFKDVLWALSIYTCFPTVLTEEVCLEAVDHIESKDPIPDSLVPMGVNLLALKLFGRNHLDKVKPIWMMNVLPSKTAPNVPFDIGLQIVTDSYKLTREYQGFQCRFKGNTGFEMEWALYLLNRDKYEGVLSEGTFKDFEGGLDPGRADVISHSFYKPFHYSGEVNFVRDKGKYRHVACPYRYEQMLLRPLGDFVYSLLRRLPWDCTFEQTKGFSAIQDHLRKGGRCFSVDLTKATDHIPLTYQSRLLRSILEPEYHQFVDLFEVISKGKWIMIGPGNKPIGTVKWTRGQPLGLYPSFGTFALWHGLLLLHLNCGEWDGKWYVLGDDIVILDVDLYFKYIKTMNDLIIPISMPKTIDSYNLAEFAGHYILSNLIVRSLNWDFSPRSIIWLGEAFGERILKKLRPEYRKLLETFGDFLSPIGCNWFSKRPYSEKVFFNEVLLESMDFIPYGNPKRLFERNLDEIAEEFRTEKVRTILAEWDRTTALERGVPVINKIPDCLVKTSNGCSTVPYRILPSGKRGFQPVLPVKRYDEAKWLADLQIELESLQKIGALPPFSEE
jgi:hypothetical protein